MDRFSDVGFDSQYQYQATIIGRRCAAAIFANFRARRELHDNLGPSNPTNQLNSMKLQPHSPMAPTTGSFSPDNISAIGAPPTPGFTGPTVTGLASTPNTTAGWRNSPTSRSVPARCRTAPGSTRGSACNTSIYNKFNGTTVGAHDNNTLFLHAWFAMQPAMSEFGDDLMRNFFSPTPQFSQPYCRPGDGGRPADGVGCTLCDRGSAGPAVMSADSRRWLGQEGHHRSGRACAGFIMSRLHDRHHHCQPVAPRCDHRRPDRLRLSVRSFLGGRHRRSCRRLDHERQQRRGAPGRHPDTALVEAKTDFLTSVTARLGYTFDHVLIYGKGGVAMAADRYDVSGSFTGFHSASRAWKIALAGLLVPAWNGLFTPHWSVNLDTTTMGSGTRTIADVRSVIYFCF